MNLLPIRCPYCRNRLHLDAPPGYIGHPVLVCCKATVAKANPVTDHFRIVRAKAQAGQL